MEFIEVSAKTVDEALTEAEKEASIMVAEGNFRAKELAAEADAIYIEKICNIIKTCL